MQLHVYVVKMKMKWGNNEDPGPSVIDEPVLFEKVYGTDIYADQRSTKRTSRFGLDATDESYVIEALDETGMYAYLTPTSRTSSLGPDATEVHHFNVSLSPDTLWDCTLVAT